jgi:DNA-binding transcriptional ArsR family regulator
VLVLSSNNEDKVFSALADGNRRRIIELLREGDSSLLELARHFSISFQALSKHIKILEEAGVIIKQQKGKFRIISLNRDSTKPMIKWINHHFDFWNESLEKLSASIDSKEK